MTNEEKKAIEELKVLIGLEEFNKLSYKENQSIKILLNLIEKQSKEIEYWKEQAEGYSGLAHQIKEDFENMDRWE